MTAKETLLAARSAKRRIESRKAELKYMEGLQEITAGSEKLAELIETVSEEIASAADTVAKAIYLISTVKNPSAIGVLYEYYINASKNWNTAAEACGYSRSHAIRLRDEALEVLDQCG